MLPHATVVGQKDVTPKRGSRAAIVETEVDESRVSMPSTPWT